MFNPVKEVDRIVKSIQVYFAENAAPDAMAMIGISGGADSTIIAGLCVKALGKDRVFGVMMPNGVQRDIDDSQKVIDILGIKSLLVNIDKMVDEQYKAIPMPMIPNRFVETNLPALVRRNTLTVLSMQMNARVMNTTNATENFLGWITKGDNIAGDFAPIIDYVKTQVIQIGLALDMFPRDLIIKTPEDGLSGKSDEENFGFSYQEADDYILRQSVYMSTETKDKIAAMHTRSAFKRRPLAKCHYGEV